MELYRLQQSQAKAFARDGGPLRQHAVAQPAPQPELEELLPERGVVVLRAACTGAFDFRRSAPPSTADAIGGTRSMWSAGRVNACRAVKGVGC
jgi:hypothetical protein